MALTKSKTFGKKMREQGSARTDLPNGPREQDLGSTAHTWQAENARLRRFRAQRAALDAETPRDSEPAKTMDDIPEQSSRSDCSDGFLHFADTYVWSSLLFFRHCA